MNSPDNISTDHSIVLFDGVCNYCNSWVNFLIRHDKKDRFRFAALQSEAGIALLKKYNIQDVASDSFVLIDNGTYHLRSGAGLRLFKYLGGLYPAVTSLLIVPSFIRNAVYRYISRNRYKWYGKKESCMIPTPEVKKKFL